MIDDPTLPRNISRCAVITRRRETRYSRVLYMPRVGRRQSWVLDEDNPSKLEQSNKSSFNDPTLRSRI
jgi:hypothetical protein